MAVSTEGASASFWSILLRFPANPLIAYHDITEVFFGLAGFSAAICQLNGDRERICCIGELSYI
jgi:hypothetical protein